MLNLASSQNILNDISLPVMRVRKLDTEKLDITTKEGFDLMYSRYSNKIFGFFMSHLQDKVLAEDLLQDVFTDLWAKRHQTNILGPLENYLITVCRYKLVDFIRSQKKELRVDVALRPEKSSEATPEDSLIFSEFKSRVLESFKQMPTRTKEIFLLSRKQGLTNRQIADNMKLSEKTVEYHIGKTLKHLRTYLSSFF